MENNKEFVTYEQALALKELGFDEVCFKYWVGEIHEYGIVFRLDRDKLNNDELLAPLKQQVFRWFRENNLYVDIGHSERVDFFYAIFKNSEVIASGNDYSSYEKAENACIDKLIKLVKKQDNGK